MRRSRLARFDDDYRARWGGLVAGVDEAGRGPLAGPVVAACVALEAGTSLRGVRDSKTLSAVARAAADAHIRARAAGVGVGVATPQEIDAFNVRMATLLAMRRALRALGMRPQGVLIDGRDPIHAEVPCVAVVDGDARSLAVAAASIVAKVARDALMSQDDSRYPGYGFAQNKGYGTPEHLVALRVHGPCPIHRRSFRPVRELLCVQEAFQGF